MPYWIWNSLIGTWVPISTRTASHPYSGSCTQGSKRWRLGS